MLSPTELASRGESAERQYATRTDNDPFLQRMNTAFLFTAVCFILWWNLQWRQAMRFWVKPANRQLTAYIFRVFFALCLAGSLNELVEQIRRHPVTGENIGAVLLTTLIVCGVVATMTVFSVWLARSRERKATDKPES